MAWKNVQYQNGKFKTTNGGGGGGSSTFADLDDVSFSNLQNGQVPKYNSTTQKWENANESGGGGTVTDVTVDGTSVVNQQGIAEITMPTPPTIPVQDVEVDGVSVVNAQGVAEITTPAPPTPDYPVTDVQVNGTSVVSNKQALIKSYKEVTQAEYNALPDSKLSDGILYAIKDSAGADGFPPLIYSDEEREVGVWYNGKPVYQKTLHYSETIVNSGVTKDISSLHIEDVIEVSGIYTRIVSGYAPFNYAFNMYEASNLHSFARVSNTDNSDLVWRIAAEGTDKQTITLLYTKSTDTAGSGTWTTQGGYAHHYSTTEQVIGTWIDGSTIYEKTFTGLSRALRANDWNTLNDCILIPNIAETINVKAMRIAGNNCLADIGLKEYSATPDVNSLQINPLNSDTMNLLIAQYTKST